MARIYEIDGIAPRVHPTAFVHPDAVLIGNVAVGPDCYIAPLASLRGDFGEIRIEAGANIQDACVVHCFPGTTTVVEEDGHVGHGSVLHGCRIGRGALIGMKSVIMDGATIGELAFVGANSFVKSGYEVTARHLAVGSPARIQRELTEEELSWKANGTRLYQELSRRSRESLRETEPRSWDETDSGPGDLRVFDAVVSGGTPAHVPLQQHRAATSTTPPATSGEKK
ncbi:acyltransferase [Streptomyces pinistramenti]|uniref:acyltransferase n=1 Tax=Streptomyces pinistramenti TaxID=2884812 RepID=UPI001D099C2A|nr:transferase hexapeptide repeat family protein [Streptomyces pinistramenti]MCB5908049.1 transferase hexapeptide repeat family protein [Streptomyces pinistramenti]